MNLLHQFINWFIQAIFILHSNWDQICHRIGWLWLLGLRLERSLCVLQSHHRVRFSGRILAPLGALSPSGGAAGDDALVALALARWLSGSRSRGLWCGRLHLRVRDVSFPRSFWWRSLWIQDLWAGVWMLGCHTGPACGDLILLALFLAAAQTWCHQAVSGMHLCTDQPASHSFSVWRSNAPFDVRIRCHAGPDPISAGASGWTPSFDHGCWRRSDSWPSCATSGWPGACMCTLHFHASPACSGAPQASASGALQSSGAIESSSSSDPLKLASARLLDGISVWYHNTPSPHSVTSYYDKDDFSYSYSYLWICYE